MRDAAVVAEDNARARVGSRGAWRVGGVVQLGPAACRGWACWLAVECWRSHRSLARAARWDGVIPQRIRSEEPLTADELRELVGIVRAERDDDRFDVVIEGLLPEHDPDEATAYTRGLAAAGASWYLDGVWMYMYETPGQPDAIRRVIRKGPPK